MQLAPESYRPIKHSSQALTKHAPWVGKMHRAAGGFRFPLTGATRTLCCCAEGTEGEKKRDARQHGIDSACACPERVDSFTSLPTGNVQCTHRRSLQWHRWSINQPTSEIELYDRQSFSAFNPCVYGTYSMIVK